MSSQPAIEILTADLHNPEHARWIVELTDAYARDPLGNGAPLPDSVLENLVTGLRAQPTAVVFLALARTGASDPLPIGIATCFGGFSTFSARPLLNIHDLYVHPAYRSQGHARRLLQAVENRARATGCCKLTLEVLENNDPARHAYANFGFAQAVYQEASGGALFFTKPLS